MRASASLSAWLAGRSPRERRVLGGGAAAAAVLLVLGLGVLPSLRQWEARRDEIHGNRERIRRYESLVKGEAALQAEVARRRAGLAARGLVTGSTPAVAASNVQALLQEYARAAEVTLDRVDVVGEGKVGDDGLAAVPVQLTAHGDIHGLVALLDRIESGGRLLLVDELAVAAGVARPGGVETLSFTLRLRAVWGAPVGSAT